MNENSNVFPCQVTLLKPLPLSEEFERTSHQAVVEDLVDIPLVCGYSFWAVAWGKEVELHLVPRHEGFHAVSVRLEWRVGSQQHFKAGLARPP